MMLGPKLAAVRKEILILPRHFIACKQSSMGSSKRRETVPCALEGNKSITVE
jgi:hypothetical protein